MPVVANDYNNNNDNDNDNKNIAYQQSGCKLSRYHAFRTPQATQTPFL